MRVKNQSPVVTDFFLLLLEFNDMDFCSGFSPDMLGKDYSVRKPAASSRYFPLQSILPLFYLVVLVKGRPEISLALIQSGCLVMGQNAVLDDEADGRGF
jgi:hypothetical protein